MGRRSSAIVSRGGSDAASDIAARREGAWIWERKWRARILPDKSRYREGFTAQIAQIAPAETAISRQTATARRLVDTSVSARSMT